MKRCAKAVREGCWIKRGTPKVEALWATTVRDTVMSEEKTTEPASGIARQLRETALYRTDLIRLDAKLGEDCGARNATSVQSALAHARRSGCVWILGAREERREREMEMEERQKRLVRKERRGEESSGSERFEIPG